MVDSLHLPLFPLYINIIEIRLNFFFFSPFFSLVVRIARVYNQAGSRNFLRFSIILVLFQSL